MEASDLETGGKNGKGSLSRKFNAGMKAISDFDVMRNWIINQIPEKDDPNRFKIELERLVCDAWMLHG